MELEKAWKISEFAKLIEGNHHNTINQWFNALEEKRIHYVNRVLGEKVYDQSDLEIARYISEGRAKKYNLQLIFDQLPDVFELRPFPLDWGTGEGGLVDLEAIKRQIEATFEEKLQKAQLEIRDEVVSAATRLLEEHRSLLPAPKSSEESRLERINDNMARMKVEWKLEEKAIEEWSKLPDNERMKRAGLFRKEEDLGKRSEFIRRYKQENMEDAMKTEYGVE
ncbi:MerR family transcriptional regulator (plasmid) [Paenibacillus rhizovicinus]|uniref:MerR family transcriptional regulator n=1 Tax=Paenibacillus rhizovicinus TaxID=2704463 RepID=A0A6C0PAC5_9BACL|nr:MerR family transcriptional regulator [Paenibacillus rhizovicinus]QHW35449.1 MerR family transcriptional regulator [Paenibacillus rhizovicinus]